MATMYFSGLEKSATIQALSRVPGAAGMMSFLQYRLTLFIECEQLGIRIAMDSGAYSKCLSRKDIKLYARTITFLGERCEWYAAPDHIGNQKKSNDNYAFLLSLLPSHLHTRVRWVYQISSSIAELEEGLEKFSMIGVGGLVPLLAGNRDVAEQKIVYVAQRIACMGKHVHYFGLAHPRLLRRLCAIHQDDLSCDSSTWLVGSKFGCLIRRDGRQIPMRDFAFEPGEMLTHNARVMKAWLDLDMQAKTSASQLALFEEVKS